VHAGALWRILSAMPENSADATPRDTIAATFIDEVTTMPALTPKTKILEQAGYVYHFDREIYFNRGHRKAFSTEFVEDHSADELEKHIAEKKRTRDWRFYFNAPLSPDVKRQLEQTLR
jgi:hypothetical protein